MMKFYRLERERGLLISMFIWRTWSDGDIKKTRSDIHIVKVFFLKQSSEFSLFWLISPIA